MLTSVEMKLLRLALDKGAYEGEAENAAVMLIRKLRNRNVNADELFKQTSSAYNSTRAEYSNRNTVTEYGNAIMTFGKHINKPIKEIPINYLTWAYNNCRNMEDSLRYAIHKYITEEWCPA
jgi:hypothetical protein